MPKTLSGSTFFRLLIVAVTGLSSGGLAAAANDEIEYLCVKDHSKTYEHLVMACYSDNGCKHVESIGGEPIRDYDRVSVPYALGRGKIEGIVTSSAEIMKKIRGFGYKCTPLP